MTFARRPIAAALTAAMALFALSNLAAYAQETAGAATGVEAKRPVFGGACKTCPWGAAAEVVKAAMEPYGYEVLICYNCSTAEAPRIVAAAKTPPPVELTWQRAPSLRELIPPPPDGPVDFGAVGVKFLWDAYRGTGIYSQDGPRENLCLIATIQSPSYLIVAVRTELGITDLAEVRDRAWPVRILNGLGSEAADVLAYYELTREDVTAAGGRIDSTFLREELPEFDIVLGEGMLTTAPEFSYWNKVSQQFDLTFLELPEQLLAQLAEKYERRRVDIPIGLLRGVDRPIPTVAVSGVAIYGRDDLAEAFAYDTARALDEHQDLLQWSHMNFSYNIHEVWKAFGVPLHPGAERYYREKGYME